ncbi:MAG: TonB-dependent SusC/RagA subfamily outer membrane receptor [Cyclobacteriaceae bacterium]|jgi:TonB-dependent SusC/RagA subfamily outer membrane receptor
MSGLIRLCKLFFLFIISFEVVGQTISLTGKVYDARTNEPIPFVNIGTLNTTKGTSSNINGEFVLNVDSLPQEIFFSHLNYSKRGIRISENNELVVKLVPVNNVLDAITVTGKKRKSYLVKLIRKAYNRAVYSRNEQYGKSFYRQTSKADDYYTELYEIFYDTKFSNTGIVDWEVQEGRYAMKTTALVNKNFTLLSRVLTTVQPKTDDFVMPINLKVEDYYEFEVIEVKKMGKREVAIINFVPLKRVRMPAFEGVVYIDINNYDILKVKGKIQHENLDFIKITGDGVWKDYVLSYELAYREESDSLFLDYISVDQSFDYYREEKLVYPVRTNSQFTFYEYYYPTKNKRLGGTLNQRRSDAALLDKIGYNKEFWEENEIVKRTPVELEVIESFESKKSFGTIYLNDQKQIVLERNDILKDTLINELMVKFQNSLIYQEKAYLHLDKPFYTTGEDIWYSAYLVDGASHQRLDGSGVLYVDLIDPAGEIVLSQNIQIKRGQGQGDMQLPEVLKTGKYILRAYTNWMINVHPDYFFIKEINIYNGRDKGSSDKEIKNKVSIRFFPEGGELVAGLTNRITFKAIDQSGKGVQIKGGIYDGTEKSISDIESIHLGMGGFFLNIEEGKDYYAKILHEGEDYTFPLPVARRSGIGMQVNNRDNTIKVIIQGTAEFEEKSYYILGQSRGRIYFRSKGLIQNRRSIMEIPKSKIPDGIFQITLFDENGLPQCERLVFIDNERGLDIEISQRDSLIESRELVDFDIKILNAEGNPVIGDFSLSVTDTDQLSKKSESGNIKSYLLLDSDLKGTIEQPGYYFKNRDKETERNLDLLMLTQGWRRFLWKDILSGRSRRIKYPMEKGLTISGIALNPSDSGPLTNATLATLISDGTTVLVGSIETDGIGRFEMVNLDLKDSTRILFNAIGEGGHVEKIKVKLSNQKYSVPAKGTGNYLGEENIGQGELQYLKLAKERNAIERAFADPKVIILDEVKIESTKQNVRSSNSIHGTPDDVIKPNPNQVYMNVFQMIQGQVAGVNVTGNTDIRIRNSPGSPLVLLDGMVLIEPAGSYSSMFQAASGGNEGGGETPVGGPGIESLLSIPPNDVERIEVLKGPSAGIYGIKGANGVIAIYTKTGAEPYEVKEKESQVFSLQFDGFYSVREFYTPNYEVTKSDHVKPDRRATLFWNPNIKTDENGRATISFYNSDNGKVFQVDLQGLSESGKPINALLSIRKTTD